MGFFWVVLAIVIISTVVGAIAKVVNNANEMNAQRPRPPVRAGGDGANANAGGGAVRPASTDMDRFLAEIDRLRKKSAEAPPPAANQAPAVPVVQPPKQQQDRPRPRVVAELVEAPRQDHGFNTPPTTAGGVSTPSGPLAGDLPMATVTAPPSGTGAPATRVTRFVSRPRPVAKTPFAKNLTTLLGSGQGLALAIVLQEVLGPPKCRK